MNDIFYFINHSQLLKTYHYWSTVYDHFGYMAWCSVELAIQANRDIKDYVYGNRVYNVIRQIKNKATLYQ